MYRSELINTHYNTSFILAGTVYVQPWTRPSDGVILLDLSSYLPISKADYKNYTINSSTLGLTDTSFFGYDDSDNSFNIPISYIKVKLVNSNLVLYSNYPYTYFKTDLSTGAPISLAMSSNLKSLPTIDFVSSTSK